MKPSLQWERYFIKTAKLAKCFSNEIDKRSAEVPEVPWNLQNEALAEARCSFCRDTIFSSGSPFSAQMERQWGPKGPPREVQGHAATVAKAGRFQEEKGSKKGSQKGANSSEKV